MSYRFPIEKHLEKIDERDKFNYSPLAANILTNVLYQMEMPNCLGLYGHWGSGKSTILSFLQEHNSKLKSKDARFISVHFEPWKYEYSKEGDLVFALLRKIEGALPNRGKKKFKDEWKRVGLSLLTSAMSIGSYIASNGTVHLDSSAIAKRISKSLQPAKTWVDEVEQLRERFEIAINEGLPKNKNVLVLIDDLDRCLPENAVRLIEALKNFLNVKRTLFVIAVDRRVIADMIQKKYGLHDGYGEEYLMKVIPYVFELPRVDTAVIVNEVCERFSIPANDNHKTYFIEFMRRFAIQPRKTKYYLHQFGMRVALGGDKLKKKLNERYTRSAIQHGSRLADLFLLAFVAQKFPQLFAHEDPISTLNMVRHRAIDPNSQYRNNKQVEAILGDNEWNIIIKVLKFGYHETNKDGNPITSEQIEEVFPLLTGYLC